MQSRAFWRVVTADRSNLLDRFLGVLRESGARFCVIGGQAVNACAEAVVTLDLHIVVVASDLEILEPILRERFTVERFHTA